MSNEEVQSKEELEKELKDLEALIEIEAKNLLDLKLRQEKLLKGNKIQFFHPSPKQEEFLKAAACKRRGVFAGNRFGKSTIGVIEDVCWLLGYRPFYEEGNPLRYLGIPQRGVKGLVIAEDWEKVKEIFTNNDPGSDTAGKFFEWLPDGCVTKLEKNSMGIVNVIHVTSRLNGRDRRSVIYFDTVKSYKLNPRGAESSDWDFIHGDEPIPQQMWNALARGLMDRGGSAWFLLTSLEEAWIYDWILEGQNNDPEQFFFLSAKTEDNPTLTKQDMDAYFSTLSEEERIARMTGKPLASGRLVYHHFDRNKHVLNELPSDWMGFQPPPTYDVCVAIDPHPQTPHAVLFCAIAPSHIIFYSEIFQKCTFSDVRSEDGTLIAEGLATKIKRRIQGCNLLYMLCDPCAWIVDPETNRCWADTMKEQGLPVVKASKSKTTGIQEMNSWFANGGDKRVYVHKSLTHFIGEVTKYYYTKENVPVDKNDHIMECMYRLCVHDNFRYHGARDNAPRGLQVSDRFSSSGDFKNVSKSI